MSIRSSKSLLGLARSLDLSPIASLSNHLPRNLQHTKKNKAISKTREKERERERERGSKMDHEADAYRTDLMTITRFVLNEQSKYPESRGDFTILLSNIVLGCKFVCSAVNKV